MREEIRGGLLRQAGQIGQLKLLCRTGTDCQIDDLAGRNILPRLDALIENPVRLDRLVIDTVGDHGDKPELFHLLSCIRGGLIDDIGHADRPRFMHDGRIGHRTFPDRRNCRKTDRHGQQTDHRTERNLLPGLPAAVIRLFADRSADMFLCTVAAEFLPELRCGLCTVGCTGLHRIMQRGIGTAGNMHILRECQFRFAAQTFRGRRRGLSGQHRIEQRTGRIHIRCRRQAARGGFHREKAVRTGAVTQLAFRFRFRDLREIRDAEFTVIGNPHPLRRQAADQQARRMEFRQKIQQFMHRRKRLLFVQLPVLEILRKRHAVRHFADDIDGAVRLKGINDLRHTAVMQEGYESARFIEEIAAAVPEFRLLIAGTRLYLCAVRGTADRPDGEIFQDLDPALQKFIPADIADAVVIGMLHAPDQIPLF